MNWLKRLFGTKVTAQAIADHLELTDTSTVLGLRVNWYNLTGAAIFINDLQLRLYPEGRNAEPHSFGPLERFTRVSGQRTFQKELFTWSMLPPGETHVDEIRFLLEQPVDLPPGKYRVEIEITDLENTQYKLRTDVLIEAKIKFRQTEEWFTE